MNVRYKVSLVFMRSRV